MHQKRTKSIIAAESRAMGRIKSDVQAKPHIKGAMAFAKASTESMRKLAKKEMEENSDTDQS